MPRCLPARLVLTETIRFAGLDLHRLPLGWGASPGCATWTYTGPTSGPPSSPPLQNMHVLEQLNLTGVPLFSADGGAAETNALWSKLHNLRRLKLGGTRGMQPPTATWASSPPWSTSTFPATACGSCPKASRPSSACAPWT